MLNIFIKQIKLQVIYSIKCHIIIHITIQDIATYINEVKRDVENIDMVKTIFSQIHNMYMTDEMEYGKFLCDAAIRYRDHKENKSFNRLIHVCMCVHACWCDISFISIVFINKSI